MDWRLKTGVHPRFEVEATDPTLDSANPARVGRLTVARGVIETPAFMPVGTYAAVRALSESEVRETGATMILANTFHLLLRPGIETLERLGGLHAFMRWPRPILTDSGGFQVFSLPSFREVSDTQVGFKSPVDGRSLVLTPESVIESQERMNSDIMMQLDECPPYPAEPEVVRRAMVRSAAWASRSLSARSERGHGLFAIVQGGMNPHLRRESAERLREQPFDGFAIGGLSVGEPKEIMMETLAATTPHLPVEKPRYLMGVGKPADLVRAVGMGVDMFDCVLPSRNARNGQALTSEGVVNLRLSAMREQDRPLDEGCRCYTCRTYSRAYLSHGFRVGEMLSARLTTLHNLTYYTKVMAQIREAIRERRFAAFHREFLARFATT